MPSLLDELLPIPVQSGTQTDTLAPALRRSGAVAVIVVFIITTIYFLISEITPEQRILAKELGAFWSGREELVVGQGSG